MSWRSSAMAGPIVSGRERSLRQHPGDVALVLGSRMHIAGRFDHALDGIGDMIHSLGIDAFTEKNSNGVAGVDRDFADAAKCQARVPAYSVLIDRQDGCRSG